MDHNKKSRLQRANRLESAFAEALRSLGYWCHHIQSQDGQAPLLDIPYGTKTRAPDLIAFNASKYVLIEVKESLIEGESVTLYRHQLDDYMKSMASLPFVLMICASSGDYSGYIGAITLDQIRESEHITMTAERAFIPVMALDLVGTYENTEVYLTSELIERVINRGDRRIDA